MNMSQQIILAMRRGQVTTAPWLTDAAPATITDAYTTIEQVVLQPGIYSGLLLVAFDFPPAVPGGRTLTFAALDGGTELVSVAVPAGAQPNMSIGLPRFTLQEQTTVDFAWRVGPADDDLDVTMRALQNVRHRIPIFQIVQGAPLELEADEPFTVILQLLNPDGTPNTTSTAEAIVTANLPLSGTTTRNAVAGVVTFDDIAATAEGVLSLTFSSAAVPQPATDSGSQVGPPNWDGLAPKAALSDGRAVFTAYAGAIVRVRRSTDNAEQDIGTVNGLLDTAAIDAFKGAGNAFLVTRYDQSGNGNHVTQAVTTLQPQYVASVAALNNRPAFLMGGRHAGSNPLTAAVAGFSTYLTILSTVQAPSDGAWAIGTGTSISALTVSTSAGVETLLYRKRQIGAIGDALTAAGAGLITGTPSLIEVKEIADNNREVWLNGVLVASNTTNVVVSPAAFTGHTVGSNVASNFPGYIPEVAVFDNQITDSERDQLGAAAAFYGAVVAPV